MGLGLRDAGGIEYLAPTLAPACLGLLATLFFSQTKSLSQNGRLEEVGYVTKSQKGGVKKRDNIQERVYHPEELANDRGGKAL